MIGRFVKNYSTALIIFISAHSNFIQLYRDFFEVGDFEIIRITIIIILGTIAGMLWSFIFAVLLWLSVPIYEYFKNGFAEPFYVNDKKHLFQDKIPLLIFFIIVFIFNIITFIVADVTLLSMIGENFDLIDYDSEPMPL
ncbi:hypothetical protein AP75_02620 [Kaistella haifensis DSM 19056]|uniref:Uncharacterized protein n=1 Tax=Kaistella haifensis DSM 19056 TaxID=1450526 RepID=A0A246BBH1_9FLAO|nr:hypothetical protein [Kaistella haifensis]OWK99032.1 hypothetical protein AP75_02620 [Kaistella haifensis DSM 19056]